MKLTKLEIIEQTLSYIKKNGRSLRIFKSNLKPTCVYRTSEGTGCAVGMWIIEEKYIEAMELNSAEDLEMTYGLNKILKPEVRGHHTEFWQDLQILEGQQQNFN